jgi:hypothetical protein
MEFLSTAELMELERIFGNFLSVKSSFTKVLEGVFFPFLLRNQNRDFNFFYKTPGDALSAITIFNIYNQ